MKVISDGIGLLVLEGLLIRRVGIDGRFGAELLAEGDLLRPWQGEDIQSTLPHTAGWRVVQPARLAVLDGNAAARFARYPALTGAIAAKLLNRSRCLALMMAIIHNPRIDTRVHMLLWHLADRWGRVRRDGIIVPLRLTHTTIADLVAAQRPTVTGSLTKLTQRELVRPTDEGWLLLGDPPGELLELQEVEVEPNNGSVPKRAQGRSPATIAAPARRS
jgi:CRP-like cAMP-binding protein